MGRAEAPGILQRKLQTRTKHFQRALENFEGRKAPPASLSVTSLLEAEFVNRRLLSTVQMTAFGLLAVKTSIINTLVPDSERKEEALRISKQEVADELTKHGISIEILESDKKSKRKARRKTGPSGTNHHEKEETLQGQVASFETVSSREVELLKENTFDSLPKPELPEEFVEYLPSAEEITAFACALPESNHNKKDMGIEELDDALIKRLRKAEEIDFGKVIEGLKDERKIKERKAEYITSLRKSAFEKILNVLALTNEEFNSLYGFLDDDIGELFVFFRLFKEDVDFQSKLQLLRKYMKVAP